MRAYESLVATGSATATTLLLRFVIDITLFVLHVVELVTAFASVILGCCAAADDVSHLPPNYHAGHPYQIAVKPYRY